MLHVSSCCQFKNHIKVEIIHPFCQTVDLQDMNADWGRPSPLDELRSRSGYFPDVSRSDDAQSICTYQDGSDHRSLMATNHSMLSFETVQTNDRLLDKLDLSIEDEALLHQALKEEEEKSRAFELKQQQNGPVICMPASQFRSLRMKGLVSPKDVDHNVNKKTLPGVSLKGNLSSSAVEQHYPAKSRYSYLAEEDSDSEYGTAALGKLHLNKNVETPSSHPRIVNFESYRVENTNYLNQYSQFLPSNERMKRMHAPQQPLVHSSESFVPRNDTAGQRDEKIYRNGSGSSTKTSFVEPGQLSKPKTQSSMESDLSYVSYPRAREKSQEVLDNTPTKSVSSPSIESVFHKELSKEPSPSYKTHKKKSSFSFKNLFKSPMSGKSKTSLDARSSFDDSNHQQSSGENSPKKKSQHLRKFILPANPVLQFEPRTPLGSSKSTKRKAHHFRSLSDFHKMPSPVPQLDASSTEKLGNHKHKPRRNLSLDSKRPTLPVSLFNTPTHSRQQSRNHLQFYDDAEEKDKVSSQDNLKSRSNSQIKAAIRMRDGGQLEESASKLRKACLSNDKTAFLLYGLALRHGCGVPRDYKESFRHIKVAAGVHSEAEEIFKSNVDPFELELNNSMPQVVPEPTAPALYECGIAYLKGYGPDQRNESFGLKYLEKAASLGHIDSMCLSATIWSKKSATRKKDIARAASWFRLAEKRGANLIGSEWIHKDKYRRRT